MPRPPWREKRTTKLWLVVLGLTALTLLAGTWFITPPPPRKIVLATGQLKGAYASFGRDYEKRLAPLGLKVEVALTNGSIDNYERLLRREADVPSFRAARFRWWKTRTGTRSCGRWRPSTWSRCGSSTRERSR